MRSLSPRTRPNIVFRADAVHMQNKGSTGVTDAFECMVKGMPRRSALPAGSMSRRGQGQRRGSKMAKIHWNAKKSTEAPAPTLISDTLHDLDFMVRDSKRFADSGNWGYAQFNYDAASDTFKPFETGAKCGFACHTIVKAKDYVFTAYPKR
jgi:hypothetical protein